MKAFILAAGLGTRLRPWTLEHPKALVPVAARPMLDRVIERLRQFGYDNLTVNVHHFADQIVNHLVAKLEINISDETAQLRDTGGALVKASEFLCGDEEPFLVHNVDILSTANLHNLMMHHKAIQAEITLLVSDRESSRRLYFNSQMELQGWGGPDGQYRPEGYQPDADDLSYAFSGIYIVSPRAVSEMRQIYGENPFSIMDFLLRRDSSVNVHGFYDPSLRLLDIGKPDSLSRAEEFLRSIED